MSLQLQIAVSGMKIIGQLGQAGQLDTLGISEADYKRLCSSTPWLPTEKHRMTAVLHSLIMGSVDALGLPRFQIPAEYMAAGICVFVHPVNIHAACIFSCTTGESELMTRGDMTTVRPEQIFALVQAMYDNVARTDARMSFERSVGLAMDAAQLATSGAGSANGAERSSRGR